MIRTKYLRDFAAKQIYEKKKNIETGDSRGVPDRRNYWEADRECGN